MTAEQCPVPLSSRGVALRIARTYLAPRWRSLTVSVVCAVLAAALSGILVNMLEPVMNGLSVWKGLGGFARLPLIIVGLGLARGVAQALQAMLVNRVGAGVVGDVQVELYGKLVRADLARLRAAHSGGFVASVLYDTGLIREAATIGGVNLVQQSFTLAAAGVIMVLKDWRLALFVLVAAPLVVLFQRGFLRRAMAAASGAMEATGRLSTRMLEGLDGVRVVKMENREAYEEARVAAVVEARQRHIVSGDNARGVAAPVSEALMMGVAAAVLAYEGWRASVGHVNIGGFIAFFGALLLASQALRQISNLSTVISQGVTAGRRLFAALDVRPEVRDVAGAPVLRVMSGKISLRGVSFAYGAAVPVLREMDLEVHRGETVALVGPSGAGKSTVLGLIPRFYDITSGVLAIDGQDIREVSLSSLRRNIGLVTQEPFLFDDTVAANIAYARSGAAPAEIEAAARAAAAHDFIMALPNGYDTIVGEAGARLSGGQRQRIAIARAFLKDAPILLLDEATSALDAESEAQVQAALARLMAGRTTLVIAHRLATVRNADRIYVLDGGRVAEVGRHDALVEAGGLYARLARSQDLAHVTGPGAETCV